MIVGDAVKFKDFPGLVRFIGQTKFAEGIWIGVELDTPDGKNNGSVNGVEYFKCAANHGIFVRESMLIDNKLGIIDKLQAKTKSMHNEIQSLNAKILELNKTKLNSNDDDIELLTIEKETLIEKNDWLNKEVKELKNINYNNSLKLNELEKQLNTSEKSVEFNDKINELTIINEELELKIQDLELQLIEFDDLKQNYSKILNELALSNELINELSNLDNDLIIDELNLKNKSLTEENNKLNSLIKEFEDLKTIESELDLENNKLIEDLNKTILSKDTQLKEKELLIETLSMDLNKIKHVQTEADPLIIEKMNNLIIDRKNLKIDVQYLSFQLNNKNEIFKSLHLDNDENYFKISYNNYFGFINDLIKLIPIDNKDNLINLMYLNIKFELKKFQFLINTFKELNALNSSTLIVKFENFLAEFIKLFKNEEFNPLILKLTEINESILNLNFDYAFKNRLFMEIHLNYEMFSSGLIFDIINLFKDEKLSLKFKELFKVLKSYELVLDSLLKEIENAKAGNNELESNEFLNINLESFLSILKMTIIKNNTEECINEINSLLIEFQKRLKFNKLIWKKIEVIESVEIQKRIEINEKDVEIDELKIKIQVLNSKLLNYKDLSNLLNDYKSKNNELIDKTETLEVEMKNLNKELLKFQKQNSKDLNSLILNNFEINSLIDLKKNSNKIELISEIQVLKRSLIFYNSKIKVKNLNWLKKELKFYKPSEIPEINELRKIGNDMRKRFYETL